MDHLKILIASEENKVREPLTKLFSTWGIETVGLSEPLSVKIVKDLAPQLVFMDKKYYGNYDFLMANRDQKNLKVNEPGIVIVVKPTDKMPLMSEVGQNSVLQMPYTASTLFDTVRQALCFRQMDSSFATVLTKLDLIYDLLIKDLQDSEISGKDALEYQLEGNQALDNGQLTHSKSEIINQSKALVLSLLNGVRENDELRCYEGRLRLLNKLLVALGNQNNLDLDDLEPVSELLKNNPLSRKEQKIFSMITNNMTTEEIADKLFISPETVKSHRRNIRKKLSLVGSKASLGDFIHELSDNDKNVSVEPDVINPSKTQKIFNHC